MRHAFKVVLQPLYPKDLLIKLNCILLAVEFDTSASDGVVQVMTKYQRNLVALEAQNLGSTKALRKITKLREIPVRAYDSFWRNLETGVAHSVLQDISGTDLASALRATVSVQHIRNIGESEFVKAILTSEACPHYVTVGHARFKVEPFFEGPLQCHKATALDRLRLRACCHDAALVAGKMTTVTRDPRSKHVVLLAKCHRGPRRIAALYFRKNKGYFNFRRRITAIE